MNLWMRYGIVIPLMGIYADISAMSIANTQIRPDMMTYERNSGAGPVSASTPPDPMNSPVPIVPPVKC